MTDKQQPDHAQLLKRSLTAINDLQAQLAEARRARTEPIAIVGMACRFPGGADSPDAFWNLLMAGTDAVTEVPPERWDVDAFYDPDPDAIGKSYTRWGSFLDGVQYFDADLFGISPREAMVMDPQQRLLLELSWEALERSGIAPSSLMGSQTAAYVGISTSDFVHYLAEAIGPYNGNAYIASGSAHSMASGRLAYVFGLHGPNAAIDTACSSSLVALHWAVQSLRNGEVDMALSAGVNLALMPIGAVLTSRARMMSFDGRCKTFDASADGYVRGEGCGVLVLKRLSDAKRDKDQILAVIRGTALNQDGRSSGLTAPNGRAQAAVLRAALKNSNLAPDDIGYIEAHGTGTSLGDPIEVKALAEVFGARDKQQPLLLSSVKSNIGHTEAAAGIAGVIKTVLALQHGVAPPHLHLKNPNPLIPWSDIPFRVPVEPTPWLPAADGLRRGGVSSFGFSGTNAHIVIEQAPATPTVTAVTDSPARLLVLSAHTEDALRELAIRYVQHLVNADALKLVRTVQTASLGRSHLEERLAIVVRDSAGAVSRLEAFLSGDPLAGARGRVSSGMEPEVVFMFTGQGAQYAGMSRELYSLEPAFRESLDQCAGLADPLLGRSLLEIIWGEGQTGGLLNDTAYTQPALFAVEYALGQLWRSWGVEPAAVMGHSVGEYVAACVAGVFSLEDGLRLIVARGRLMSQLPRNGAMAAVFADEDTVRATIVGSEHSVSVAAVNGPSNVVISGSAAAIETIVEHFAERGIESQPLAVSHAFHSPLMDPILDSFEAEVRGVKFSLPRIALVSNLTGRAADVEVTRPAYWARHLRDAVRFSDSVQTLVRDGFRVFLEVGPTPTLSGMARRCPDMQNVLLLSSLRKGRGDIESMFESLGNLYARGTRVRWPVLPGHTDFPTRPVDAPTYPFQRQRYWQERTLAGDSARLRDLTRPSKLVEGLVSGALPVYQGQLSLTRQPWMADHRILDYTLFPAAGFIEFLLVAAREVSGSLNFVLRDLEIREGLRIPEEDAVVMQVAVTPGAGDQKSLQLFGRRSPGAAEAEWKLHVSGSVAKVPPVAQASFPAPLKNGLPLDPQSFYTALANKGAIYGPAFRGIVELATEENDAVGRIELPATIAASASSYILHPALLDAAFQMVGALLPAARDPASDSDTYMPVGVRQLQVWSPGFSAAHVHVRIEPYEKGTEFLHADLTLAGDDGSVFANIIGLTFKRATAASLKRAMGVRASEPANDWLYELQWRAKDPSVPVVQNGGHWVVLADQGSLANDLVPLLQARGLTVSVVRAESVSSVGDDGSELLQSLRQQAGQRPDAVVSLWTLPADSELCAATNADEVEAAVRYSVSRTLLVAQALLESDARLYLVSRGAQAVAGSPVMLGQSPLAGLGNVIAAELPALRCTRIDLDPQVRPGEAEKLLAALLDDSAEDRIAIREGRHHVARLIHGELQEHGDAPLYLDITERGQLDNLALREVARVPPGVGQVELRVFATGLNFRDVLNALGAYPGDPGPLGNECAGVVTAVGAGVTDFKIGDEVVSMVDRSFARWVVAPAVLTAIKPVELSFAEAASIPVAFLTASHALHELGRIRKGDRVLIHAVTGGVGMAAVQIARLAGAEIFGTAGTPAKRKLARSLGVHHVSDSRSLAFADDFRRDSNNEGMDIVLNSLAGEFIPASLGLLRTGGRFIEIGKTGIWDAGKVASVYPAVEYFALYLGELAASRPTYLRDMLRQQLAQFASGELQVMPMRLFPLDKAQDAFRFMAQGHHIGKIVLVQHRPPEIVADATYLITGGLGGLGLTCAQWLVARGAKHLLLLGRKSPSPAAQQVLEALREAGANLRIAPVDISHTEEVRSLLSSAASEMPALRGILHAAGIVDDGILAEQSIHRFEAVMAPKVAGTLNLHRFTRGMPLDFFVCFSSGAALMGSPGQSNYAAANSFLDGFSSARRASGRHAVSINWGSWSDVGMASGIGEQHQRRWAAMGLRMIDPAAGVQMLESILMKSSADQAAALPMDTDKLPENSGAFLSEIVSNSQTHDALGDGISSREILENLGKAPQGERKEILVAYLADQLVRVFALGSAFRVDPHRSIMEMGMDSLMATELRNRLQSTLKVTVAVTDLLSGPSAEQLADNLLLQLLPVPAEDEEWEEGTL